MVHLFCPSVVIITFLTDFTKYQANRYIPSRTSLENMLTYIQNFMIGLDPNIKQIAMPARIPTRY